MDFNFKAELGMACLIDIPIYIETVSELRLQTILKPNELTFFEKSGKVG